VVLAEFAQVLPRRRLRVLRTGNTLKVALHGPSPLSGPMLQFDDSGLDRDAPFMDVSFVNAAPETGRNRVEVVLQQQDSGINSELGWRDLKVLAESVVGAGTAGGGTNFDPMLEPSISVRNTTGVARAADGRTVVRRAGGEVALPGIMERGPAVIVDGPLMFDPAFWSEDVSLPSGGGKRRVLVREFERYYSDNTFRQRFGNTWFTRRVIEERLVFADVVDPATLA
jgi:hypothetical protein